ncbi:palmitoyltransferase ZDHHC21 isoform X3 [Corapipo altera]|uniref:palmitoyltransferase ZDHHC21 isoform X3 n=1 Tax=Corapipo altera TaxID=415028 RepID=UPI000FD65309|nr:palmitoyltransferase ZDHHC21 isoform X3 [Corapipo altera]
MESGDCPSGRGRLVLGCFLELPWSVPCRHPLDLSSRSAAGCAESWGEKPMAGLSLSPEKIKKEYLFFLGRDTCLCSMGQRIHFVVDPQGWCCMGLIILVWLYNTVFIPKVILFPHYEEGNISVLAVLCYYFCSLFCIGSLLRASVADPGKLPENPKIPITEREYWELCNKCNMMRPKRSHHCSRCGHCVRRMDHHCPWINNCVGEDNHWLFLQLCFYTQILSSYTLILDFCHYYYFLPLKKENWDTTGIEKMSNCCEDMCEVSHVTAEDLSVCWTSWSAHNAKLYLLKLDKTKMQKHMNIKKKKTNKQQSRPKLLSSQNSTRHSAYMDGMGRCLG